MLQVQKKTQQNIQKSENKCHTSKAKIIKLSWPSNSSFFFCRPCVRRWAQSLWDRRCHRGVGDGIPPATAQLAVDTMVDVTDFVGTSSRMSWQIFLGGMRCFLFTVFLKSKSTAKWKLNNGLAGLGICSASTFSGHDIRGSAAGTSKNVFSRTWLSSCSSNKSKGSTNKL